MPQGSPTALAELQKLREMILPRRVREGRAGGAALPLRLGFASEAVLRLRVWLAEPLGHLRLHQRHVLPDRLRGRLDQLRLHLRRRFVDSHDVMELNAVETQNLEVVH
eukprot:CAMPEP_0174381618 /NCGR_PEP_ID=MMETSP0811_2-20130205/124135_1 /TAXON_ID=73025 ORGANISM="Eutreptiella gymnastica-like, Strain CCMP1594" /NCGR_SAMPLE_ID=MMETSP0811_2 /ASSEMBLY_ACC=CAM_ASM_000667 /LENGTH=107 /DNA_ID=CAMNT_0015534821 /DNA_START=965 /DNA_END=1288 /DNA_ORIENTATION=+